MMMILENINAVILAGGQGQRMSGEDKGLLLLKNKPLYQYVLERLQGQVATILINANRNLSCYQQSGYPVFSDQRADFIGPLAGIYQGLQQINSDWGLFVSCDTPFLPTDLAERLFYERKGRSAAFVFDGERAHPTLLLLHRQNQLLLADYLATGARKLRVFLQQIRAQPVDFSDCPQCFININHPQELTYWEQHENISH